MTSKTCYKNTLITIAIIFSVIASILYIYLPNQNIATARQELRTDITVVLYTKNGCMYCELAQKLLKDKAIAYEVIELTNKEDLIIKLVNQTGQNTVPYVFINDKFIGGYKHLAELDENGEL
jgi:glutaredoxin 3